LCTHTGLRELSSAISFDVFDSGVATVSRKPGNLNEFGNSKTVREKSWDLSCREKNVPTVIKAIVSPTLDRTRVYVLSLSEEATFVCCFSMPKHFLAKSGN